MSRLQIHTLVAVLKYPASAPIPISSHLLQQTQNLDKKKKDECQKRDLSAFFFFFNTHLAQIDMDLTRSVGANGGKEVPSQGGACIFEFSAVFCKEDGTRSMSIPYTYNVTFLKSKSVRFAIEWIIEMFISGIAEIANRMSIPP